MELPGDTNSSGGFFVCCMYKKMKTSSIELQLDLRILYLSIIHQYTNFRPNYRSEGGATMDLKAVGQRIKAAREAKNLTQEELAALVNLSTTHVSVIERGLKVTKLDTFVAIANALDVSADALLIDVVTHSVTGVTNELSDMIGKLPKDEQKRILNAVRALVD
jgi:transcriptional regulator with XRE-family HTH domain